MKYIIWVWNVMLCIPLCGVCYGVMLSVPLSMWGMLRGMERYVMLYIPQPRVRVSQPRARPCDQSPY